MILSFFLFWGTLVVYLPLHIFIESHPDVHWRIEVLYLKLTFLATFHLVTVAYSYLLRRLNIGSSPGVSCYFLFWLRLGGRRGHRERGWLHKHWCDGLVALSERHFDALIGWDNNRLLGQRLKRNLVVVKGGILRILNEVLMILVRGHEVRLLLPWI